MRRAIAAALGSMAFAAQATTYSTDATDLWWNETESGWGANVIQQGNTLFITLFVYGADGRPVWYVAPATSATTGFVFNGPLYETTGPWLGGPFNPNDVRRTPVGTITFEGLTVNSASLRYVVNGVAVSKSLTRQTWVINRLAGNYLGASIGTYSAGCPSPGYSEEPAFIGVTQGANTISVTAQFVSGGSCTYSGAYQQMGRTGAATGNVACSDGTRGTFTAVEIDAGVSGFTARALVQFGACRWEGRLGGLVRN